MVDRSSKHARFRLRTKLFAAILATCSTIAAVEVALRLLVPAADELVFLSKDGSIEWDCYCSNPRGYFRARLLKDGRTVYCVDHSADPPRDVDLADARYKDRFKVLAIGDSFTWGLGVKLSDSWPLKLGQLLDLAESAIAIGGKPVVVSNRGQIGFDVAAIRETYFQAIAKVMPDVCIYGYCLNDPLDMTVQRSQFVHARAKAKDMDNGNVFDGINIRTQNLKILESELPFAGLRRRSRLVDLALSRWEWRRISDSVIQAHLDLYDPAKNAAGLRVSYGFIADMNRQQKAAGKGFLVAIFPLFVDVEGNYPFLAIHQQLAAEFKKLGIDFVDLLPVYRAFKTETLTVHPVDRHPNETAHRLAADAMMKRLVGKQEK